MIHAFDKALKYVQDQIYKLLEIHQESAKSNAELNQWKVEQIRRAWEEGWQKEDLHLFLDKMAKAFGVSRHTISNVINYRIWKDVKPGKTNSSPGNKEVELSWYDREFIKKLEKKSEIDSDTGCWNWQGKINKKSGDPVERYRGLVQDVELVAYQIHTGDIDVDYLWKICGNKNCVNPIHIRSSNTLVDCLAHTPDTDISDYRYKELGMEVVRGYRKEHNINV